MTTAKRFRLQLCQWSTQHHLVYIRISDHSEKVSFAAMPVTHTATSSSLQLHQWSQRKGFISSHASEHSKKVQFPGTPLTTARGFSFPGMPLTTARGFPFPGMPLTTAWGFSFPGMPLTTAWGFSFPGMPLTTAWGFSFPGKQKRGSKHCHFVCPAACVCDIMKKASMPGTSVYYTVCCMCVCERIRKFYSIRP